MNFKVLADNLGIDEDDYLELLVIFLERGTADLRKCRAAIAERDAQLAAGAIHSFKGASGQLGLTRLHEGAIAAEKGIKNGRMEQSAPKIDPMLNEMDTLAARVKAVSSLPPD